MGKVGRTRSIKTDRKISTTDSLPGIGLWRNGRIWRTSRLRCSRSSPVGPDERKRQPRRELQPHRDTLGGYCPRQERRNGNHVRVVRRGTLRQRHFGRSYSLDRQSVVLGRSVYGVVDFGGRRLLQKKKI